MLGFLVFLYIVPAAAVFVVTCVSGSLVILSTVSSWRKLSSSVPLPAAKRLLWAQAFFVLLILSETAALGNLLGSDWSSVRHFAIDLASFVVGLTLLICCLVFLRKSAGYGKVRLLVSAWMLLIVHALGALFIALHAYVMTQPPPPAPSF